MRVAVCCLVLFKSRRSDLHGPELTLTFLGSGIPDFLIGTSLDLDVGVDGGELVSVRTGVAIPDLVGGESGVDA